MFTVVFIFTGPCDFGLSGLFFGFVLSGIFFLGFNLDHFFFTIALIGFFHSGPDPQGPFLPFRLLPLVGLDAGVEVGAGEASLPPAHLATLT